MILDTRPSCTCRPPLWSKGNIVCLSPSGPGFCSPVGQFSWFSWSVFLFTQDRLKWLLLDGSTEGLVVSKSLYLNLNFSCINRISLLLISNSYTIVLTRMGGPRSRPYTVLPGKILGYSRQSNPGPLEWQSDVLTPTPNRRSFTISSLHSVVSFFCRLA